MIFPQVLKIGTPALTHSQLVQESSHLLVTNAGGTSTAIVPAGGAMAADGTGEGGFSCFVLFFSGTECVCVY